MAIRVACPACQTPYDIDEGFRGKQVVCAQCEQHFQIGGAPLPAATSEEAEVVAAPRRQPSRGAWIALGATFFVVIGVVVFVLVYLVNTMGGDTAAKSTRAVVPNRATGRQGPEQILGDLANDPQTDQPASHVNPPLESGMAGLHQFATSMPAPTDDGSGQKAPKNLESMPSEVLRRVKRGTVFIRVERNEEGEGGTGSGFFCFEKGLVVTNAHVIGMMQPSDPVPKKIEVILFSNERDELRLRGTVYHVDRKMDLALLRVPNNERLPEPLALVSAETLELTQQVFVVGFPFGERLGKDVSINRTSISSLRREKGVMREVQTSGGMNPGNSGGPVVDALGRVIGIAVRIRIEEDANSGIKNTGLNFAVPSDYAHYLAQGNVTELSLYPPAQEGSSLRVPVRAHLVDPLRRVRKVAAECWTGPAGAERPGGQSAALQPGDSARQSQPLQMQDGHIHGEISLPTCPPGHVYWLQLVVEDRSNKRSWTSAHSFKADPRATLRRVAWTPSPVAQVAWQSEWCSTFSGTLSAGRGGLNLGLDVRNLWAEPRDGHRRQEKFDVGFRLQNEAVPHKISLALAGARHGGKLPTTEDDADGLTQMGKFYLQALAATQHKTGESLEPVLPDKTLQPLESWQGTYDLPLDCLMLVSQAPQMRFTYTYLGMGQYQGRAQAVIAVEGRRVRSNDNSTQAVLSGIAMVDAATRKTTLLYATTDAETEGTVQLQEFPLSGQIAVAGTFHFRLKRTLPGNRR